MTPPGPADIRALIQAKKIEKCGRIAQQLRDHILREEKCETHGERIMVAAMVVTLLVAQATDTREAMVNVCEMAINNALDVTHRKS